MDEISMLNYRYRLVGELDEHHNMYLVQNTNTKQIFVRKELPRYSLRVLRQIQNHPIDNIPQIIELVELDDRVIVIEEYISGFTMQKYMDLNGHFSEEQTMDYILQLCAIVNQLHHAEPVIIHRDIKPANIMISADNVVKLLDLDAAKHYHPGKDKDTITLGTVGFAAPEQYGVGASSVQTDIYSIGALINVMLCGELPSVQMAESPLSPIIRTCLAVNPSERYQSVEELMDAIQQTQNPTPESTYAHFWQNYLPPGCRSLRPIETALSSVGYALIIWMGATYEPSEPEGIILIWMERILFSLTFLGIAFLSGNYLNIQSRLPFTKSKNIIIKLFGILVYDLAIFTLCPMIAGITKGFFL